MRNSKKMKLLNQEVVISEQTNLAMLMHNAFVSQSVEWLLKNDPDCSKESEFIEAIRASFRRDFLNSIDKLSFNQIDDLVCEFSDLHDDDWWWELREVLGFDS